jgi:hypothetical protein
VVCDRICQSTGLSCRRQDGTRTFIEEESLVPHVAEIGSIARTLENILAGKPLSHGALAVVPVLAPMLSEPGWLTLAEAGDRVRITEVDEAGAVPQLKVVNLADQTLLLLGGEELVGAKQNRVLNTTVLVAARSALTIPVRCVDPREPRRTPAWLRREASPC